MFRLCTGNGPPVSRNVGHAFHLEATANPSLKHWAFACNEFAHRG